MEHWEKGFIALDSRLVSVDVILVRIRIFRIKRFSGFRAASASLINWRLSFLTPLSSLIIRAGAIFGNRHCFRA